MKTIWMPHAGHFICGRDCGFRLNTYVNGYIVSTVGELKFRYDRDDAPFRALGASPDSLYETMVFRAMTSDSKCCPYVQASGDNLDGARYADADAATEGHMRMIAKWSEAARGDIDA